MARFEKGNEKFRDTPGPTKGDKIKRDENPSGCQVLKKDASVEVYRVES